MSQDDFTPSASSNDELHDEGMIHEWLDGQLDATTSAQMDALVQSDPVFAARVAEARGLIAASSRILGALDSVPADVLPVAASARTTVSSASVSSDLTLRVAPRKPKPVAWRRWGSIAALLMVGVTGVFVANRKPVSVREVSAPTIGVSEADAPAIGAAPVPDSGQAAAAATSDRALAESSREMSAVAPQRAPATANAAPIAADQLATADRSAAKASAQPDLAVTTRARVISPESLVSPVERTGGRVAADPAQRPSISALSVAPAAPPQQRRFAPSAAGAAMASEAEARDASTMVVISDIESTDLVVAVQRVRCAPVCQQTRVELATDGRLRRWVQAAGGSTPSDTAHVALAHVTRVQQLIVSLDLASLPAMVRLQGSQCVSVGNLRESLRVEFSVDGTVRSSMGLPWCSNGTHALDRIAAAVEELAKEQFANGARR